MQLQIYQRWKNVNEISVVSGVILLVYSTVSVTVPWEDFVTYLPPFPCKNQNDYSKGRIHARSCKPIILLSLPLLLLFLKTD